jgi:hypothetical protein
MAPELMLDDIASAASDVYAFGILSKACLVFMAYAFEATALSCASSRVHAVSNRTSYTAAAR